MFDFAAPSQGTVLKPSDVENHVLVVEPLEYVANMTTTFGDSDAVKVNVHDITDQTTYEGVLWFSSALVGSLKTSIGKKVLGVMDKGTAKAGQSAPWILVDASGNADAITAATAYLTGQVAATITAPATSDSTDSALNAALGNLAGLNK